jgi:proline utilization trans-activator
MLRLRARVCTCACSQPETDLIPVCLGTSSNWSFSRRILDAASKAAQGVSLDREGLVLDGDLYDLSWNEAATGGRYGVPTLPTPSHAVYLLQAVQFHIGDTYHLLDQDVFTTGLNDYYSTPASDVHLPSLWHVHFMIIMAFGKAFTSTRVSDRRFPGIEYFQHAMRLLPDVTQLWKDPFTAAEILCSAALYLQCMDFRYGAYNMVSGQLDQVSGRLLSRPI